MESFLKHRPQQFTFFSDWFLPRCRLSDGRCPRPSRPF
jgi:hypothetical protein